MTGLDKLPTELDALNWLPAGSKRGLGPLLLHHATH